MRLLTCLCVVAFYGQGEAAYYPPYIKPCKVFNPDFQKCWKESLENLRPYVATGIRELNIPQSDPLHISKLTISRKQSDTAVYDAYLKNILITGLKDGQILNAKLDLNTLLIRLKVVFPKLKWSTGGHTEGSMLGFPLNGTFQNELNFVNLAVDLVLDGKEYDVYGRKHIDWSRGSIEVTYDSVSFAVSGLINDPYLLQAFSNTINQNAFLLADHVKPLVENSVGQFIIEVINRIHATYSRDVLYPKY